MGKDGLTNAEMLAKFDAIPQGYGMELCSKCRHLPQLSICFDHKEWNFTCPKHTRMVVVYAGRKVYCRHYREMPDIK
jgi:hypothetical protein